MIPLISSNCDEGMKFTRVSRNQRLRVVRLSTYFKDCECFEGCSLCMIQLRLDVRCDTAGVTFEVTSNHLEVHRMQDFEGGGTGEELEKRPEYFGWPVTKSAVFLSLIVARLMDLKRLVTMVPLLPLPSYGRGRNYD